MKELLYKDHRADGTTNIRKMQLISLHLLAVLQKVCKEQGMRCWLAYGNMLGAVRNGCFIPWDDDIDVYMMYKDVRRLAKVADSAFPQDVIWQDPWRLPRLATTFFARLRDAYSTLLEDCGACPRRTTDPLGVPLDIFMLRPVRGKWGLEFLQRIRGPIEWRYRIGRETGPITAISLLQTWVRGCIHVLVDVVYHLRLLVPMGRRYYIQENVSAVGTKFIYPADWFEREREIMFEDETVLIPSDIDGYCTMVFGKDYMTPRNTKEKFATVPFMPTTPCPNERAMKYPVTE